MVTALLLILVVASWVYWLLAWWCTRDFFLKREPDTGYTPRVSILKPLHGHDVELYQNLVSFCQQDYPKFEVLCGVSDPADPAVSIVRRVQESFPQASLRMIVAPQSGPNEKASTLERLAAEAQFEVLVISDSDMRVTADYLRRVVAPLADTQTGLVTCPYRGRNPVTFTARLEALYMTTIFLPSVMVARRVIRMGFALGATMALRRSDMQELGGFAALVDYLADDFQLALRIISLGRSVRLSPYVVESVLGATTFSEQWQREVRWARTNRVNRPREYPGILLTFSTPLSLALLVISGLDAVGWGALAFSLSLRWLAAWSIMGYAGDRSTRRYLPWLPLRDLLSCLIWCVGGFGRHVVWRGKRYGLTPDGRLVSETAPVPAVTGGRIAG